MTALHAFRRPSLWLAAWIAMLLATLVVCLIPLPPSDVAIENLDKFEHAIGYALLAAYAAMLFATRRALLQAAVGLIAFGAVIEALQSFTGWRSADALDLLANTLGVSIGSLLAPRGALLWLDRRLP